MTKIGRTLVLFLALSTLASTGFSQVGVGTDLFRRKQTRIGITAGMGSAFDKDYLVAGLGAGYFIARGLEVGVDGEAWLGNNPGIYKLSPQVRYAFYQLSPQFIPYVGAFYKRTYYESYDDLDSYGGRVGIFAPTSRNIALGVGMVYEKYMDCEETVYTDCSDTYPEFSISAWF